MRDRNLELNIKRLEAFVEHWKGLSQFLDRGFKMEAFSGEDEAAFLDLKSKIAQEYELVMSTIGNASDRDDRTLKLLNCVPSLQSFRDLPEGTGKKIATDWHTAYMAMQALLGRLKGKQAQFAAQSSLRQGLKNVFSNPLMALLILVAAGYGAYRFADDWLPKLKVLMERNHDKTGPGNPN